MNKPPSYQFVEMTSKDWKEAEYNTRHSDAIRAVANG
jgi:hypothetical protein